MILLKLIGRNIPVFEKEVAFDFFASQRVTGEESARLVPLFDNMYANPVNVLVGINASGKTRSLEFISFAIALLRGEALDGKPFLGKLLGAGTIEIESYFYLRETESVCRLITAFSVEKTPNGKVACRISKESLFEKPAKFVRLKKQLFDFNGIVPQVRNPDEQYLSEDTSMIISRAKHYRDDLHCFDPNTLDDRNATFALGKVPPSVLLFLDPSIEYLEIHDDNDSKPTVIKFREIDEPILLKGVRDLELYLSSGTIRGVRLINVASYVLGHGGYMIVDEIENHFNMEIVKSLIRVFMDPEVNKKGGILIFSTHQPVLLDEMERNDGITILRHDAFIRADNLRVLLDRNDLKKSDIYESDYLHGTAPSYDRFMALRSMIAESHD